MTKKVDSRKEILNLIDQTIADTNYIKDDNAISNNIYKLLSNWIMLYFVISLDYALFCNKYIIIHKFQNSYSK